MYFVGNETDLLTNIYENENTNFEIGNKQFEIENTNFENENL